MGCRLYLSMFPEALVVSMLPPEEFGTYLAVGTAKRSRGQAMYFDLDPDFRSGFFKLDDAIRRCVPHPDGRPKHSVYAGVYRVMEHVPREAVRSLWLATPDGRVLEIKPSEEIPAASGQLHLYQEICPVHPLIASTLEPREFCGMITDPSHPVHVPRICFAQMELGALADDPLEGDATNLPYRFIDHLRVCLNELLTDKERPTKTVDRIHPPQFPYRCVKSGFYLGDQEGMLFFPFPTRDELETKYYTWWRSAVG